eukprot:1144099-Pelagomonas_calceolata.AAC.2
MGNSSTCHPCRTSETALPSRSRADQHLTRQHTASITLLSTSHGLYSDATFSSAAGFQAEGSKFSGSRKVKMLKSILKSPIRDQRG